MVKIQLEWHKVSDEMPPMRTNEDGDVILDRTENDILVFSDETGDYFCPWRINHSFSTEKYWELKDGYEPFSENDYWAKLPIEIKE